jgi:hypothetical protein
MKLHTLAAYLVVVLLFSASLHAEIISTGDWSGDQMGGGSSSGSPQSTGAYSQSRGSLPAGWSGGEGWQDLCTTEEGWLNYSGYIYAYAFAEVDILSGGYAHAYAYASASATSPYQNISGSASAYVSSTGYDQDGPDEDHFSGTRWFDESQGCSAYHTGVAATDVSPGSANIAFAHGCVTARVTLN